MNDLRFALHQLRKSPGFTAIAVIALAFFAAVALAEAVQTPIGTFPFTRDGQLMLVEARIEKAPPASFILDSGASHTVFDPTFAKELGLDVKEAPPTSGTGSGTVAKSHARAVVMKLGEVKIDIAEPWVIDLSKAPFPRTVRGLIGAELFKAFVVRIDPLQSKITVFDPASYRHESEAESIPLLVEGDKLFLEAALEVPAGRVVTHKLRIDTGSESSVNDEIARESSEVRTSTLGGGLGENFQSYSGLFSSVKLGPFTVNHVWGPAGPNPAIGMELLRRFIITFDAPHGRLYLEPTPALAEPVPTPPAS